MTLVATIKSDQLSSRKARDNVKTALLTTLLGELQTLAKNSGREEPTDAQAVEVVKKFLKNNGVAQAAASSATNRAYKEELEIEQFILQAYLPKQLSEEELRALIKGFAAEGKDIGDAMKTLKTQYAGMYDGGLASKLMKAMLP
jgi:uncharacterized protein YqeY